MEQRFYWLKLKKDFFKRHDIKIIEAMPNGKDYILFYLKLLCESVDHEGNLRFSEQIPYNEEMLSVITNTNVDIVRSAIKIFSQLNMMEIMDDGTYFMNEVNKMIGYETEWAKKKREYREKQKLGQCPQDVLPMSDKSIEKEKDKELDKDINTFVQNFEKFWCEYPKKIGKDKCLKWFKSHKVNTELLNKMLDTISKFKKSRQWDNPQYIPHPYTWLNRGGWDDELESNDNFTSGNHVEIVWQEL